MIRLVKSLEMAPVRAGRETGKMAGDFGISTDKIKAVRTVRKGGHLSG